jgi:AcrR family transcriptional regulator
VTSREAGGEATRERIAAAALELLERDGPEAVSMRRVAKMVGVTPMAIYHHYADRQALLQALVYSELEKLNALAARAAAPCARPADLIRAADAYLDYALERPHMFDYIYSARRPRPVRYPEDIRARKSLALTSLADEIAVSMEQGEMAKDDVWEVTLQCWAHTHGFVALYRAGWFTLDEKAFRALYHRAVMRLARGLRATS